MHAVRELVDDRAQSVVAWLLMAVLVASVATAFRQRTGWPLLVPVLALVLGPFLSWGWRVLYGPIRARRLPIRRVSVEQMFERAQTVAFADLPPAQPTA